MKTTNKEYHEDREKLSITKDILVCLAAAAFVIDSLAILAVLVGEQFW